MKQTGRVLAHARISRSLYRPSRHRQLLIAVLALISLEELTGCADIPLGEREGRGQVFSCSISEEGKPDLKVRVCSDTTDNESLATLAEIEHGVVTGSTTHYGDLTIQCFVLIPLRYCDVL